MGELSRRLWRRVSFGIKKPQRRTSGHKSASHCRESREEISMNNPTILRTRHKFGDYLSQPDIAKFELPKKMSRPWIVNNAYEEEKLKTLIVTETPVEASEVMLQIKEVKAERRKHVGYNKKQVRNINEIIEKDDQKEADRDIEMEQQKMMNRVFNCPNLYSASGPFTTMVQMVPVVVPNQNGGFFVVQLPVQPLPQNIFQSTQPSPFSCSSTCSSASPPASDDGFVDGSDESADETESLAEMVEDKLDLSLEEKMDLSLEEKLDLSLEESDNEIDFEILDEDLERVVRSIIEEDD